MKNKTKLKGGATTNRLTAPYKLINIADDNFNMGNIEDIVIENEQPQLTLPLQNPNATINFANNQNTIGNFLRRRFEPARVTFNINDNVRIIEGVQHLPGTIQDIIPDVDNGNDLFVVLLDYPEEDLMLVNYDDMYHERRNQRRGGRCRRKTLKKRRKNKRKTRRKKRKKTRKKWSIKYKKSINCNNPKGFSQKQYCKYGRKRK